MTVWKNVFSSNEWFRINIGSSLRIHCHLPWAITLHLTQLNVNVYKFIISERFHLSNFKSCWSVGRKALKYKAILIQLHSFIWLPYNIGRVSQKNHKQLQGSYWIHEGQHWISIQILWLGNSWFMVFWHARCILYLYFFNNLVNLSSFISRVYFCSQAVAERTCNNEGLWWAFCLHLTCRSLL